MIHSRSRAGGGSPGGESYPNPNLNPYPSSQAAALRILILLVWGLAGGLSQGLTGFNSSRQQQELAEFNRVIQTSAFRAFKHPRTGVILTVPVNASVAQVQAVRLRTGSLRRRGISFNEFTLPIGASPSASSQYPIRIVLVYRSFSPGSLYSLLNFTIVSPIVGIKVYDAFNLSNPNPVPEIEYQSGFSNLTVRIPLNSAGLSIPPSCAAFESSGSVAIFDAQANNVCSWGKLGDFGLVVPGPALAPAPVPAPAQTSGEASKRKKRRSKRWKAILGGVLGGVGGLLLLALLGLLIVRFVRRSRVARMEQQSERGEMLQSSLIGSNRAPIAGASRTKPVLESDYSA